MSIAQLSGLLNFAREAQTSEGIVVELAELQTRVIQTWEQAAQLAQRLAVLKGVIENLEANPPLDERQAQIETLRAEFDILKGHLQKRAADYRSFQAKIQEQRKQMEENKEMLAALQRLPRRPDSARILAQLDHAVVAHHKTKEWRKPK